MYCKNCGKLIEEGDRFCSGCGTKVEEKPFFESQPVSETPKEASEEKPKKKFHIEEFNWDLDGYPTDKKKTEDIDFNWASVLEEKQRRAFGQALSADKEEKAKAPEAEEDSKSLEEEIFGDLERMDRSKPTRPNRQTGKAERIDKFYTFNKKNAAFQELLDQEYERIKNGEDPQLEEMPPFVTDEGMSKEAVLDQILEASAAVADAVAPADIPEEKTESNLIGVMWAQTPECIIAADENNPERKLGEPKAAVAAEKPSCPPSEAEKREERHPGNKLTFDDVFGTDDNDRDEKPKKKGKVLKVIGIILCVLVVLELAMIGIQYFAPDSAPAKMINQGYQYVLDLFSGADTKDDKDVPADSDISNIDTLIKANEDKNKNIAEIVEDQNILFSDDKDYGFEDFGNSITFTDTSWYTGDDGKTVTFGDAIIGTLIQYYSSWVDMVNGKNDKILNYVEKTSDFYAEVESIEPEDGVEYGIDKLSIGEIRSAGAGFYVLTSITKVSSDTKKEAVENHIVYLEPDKKTMKIVEIKNI